MSVQQKHGGELSAEEFRKFTLYCNQSNNYHDDTKRAEILGQTGEDVRIAPGAIVRIRGNQIGKKSYIGLYSYVNGNIEIGENVLIGPTANIVGSNHVYNPQDDFFSSRSDAEGGKVVIEDGVWPKPANITWQHVALSKTSLYLKSVFGFSRGWGVGATAVRAAYDFGPPFPLLRNDKK